jgi:hypothetical protein
VPVEIPLTVVCAPCVYTIVVGPVKVNVVVVRDEEIDVKVVSVVVDVATVDVDVVEVVDVIVVTALISR